MVHDVYNVDTYTIFILFYFGIFNACRHIMYRVYVEMYIYFTFHEF